MVAAIRGLALVCAVLAGGVALWRTLAADVDTGGPAGPGDTGLRMVGFIAGVAAIVLVTAELLLQPARMLGSFAGSMDRELLGYALGSDLGTAAAMRLFGLMLVVLALSSARAVGAGLSALAAAGAVLVASSWTFAGHTATSDLRWILGPSLTAHVLIVMFWAGGVAGLWFASRTSEPYPLARRTAAFSRMAILPVPMIAVLGVIMAWGLVPEWRALLSGYGLLLLAKALGFALLLALAAVNRWSLTPRLVAGDRAAIHVLRRTLTAEAALLTLVLLLTTVMTLFYSPYQVVR